MPMLRLPKLPSDLSTEQKAASVILIFLGLGGIIMGFMSFGANIRRPFEEQMANAPKGFLLQSEKEAKALEASKLQDTDGDGLSDYDETYIFKTSPYIADTDSDGIDDRTEVYAGTDPNCPKGKNCNVEAPAAAEAVPAPNPAASPTVLPTASIPTAAPSDINTPAGMAVYLKSLSVAEIRSLLLQAGVAEEKLKALSDDEVRVLFQKTVDETLKVGETKTQ